MKDGPFDDDLSFDELGALMCHWATCEVLCFTKAEPGSEQQRVPLGMRKQAAGFFRTVLMHYCAQEELGAALTLFDALFLKAIKFPPQQFLTVETLMEKTSLAAILRLVLKCSSVPIAVGPSVSAIEEKLGLEELLQTELITVRELHIWKSMAGRVAAPSLPAPGQWLGSLLRRLEFLSAPQPEQVAEFEKAVGSAFAATDLLTRSVGMSSSLPPRALALGGCVLGFIAAGAVPAEQARPKDLPSSLWESVLVLWQGGHANQCQPRSMLGFDLKLVAEASCCSTSDLQVWAFRSAQAFHDSVRTIICNAGNVT